MRRLTVGNDIRGFLKSNDLAIGKLTSVVDQREGSKLVAHVTRTSLRLGDPTAINLYLHSMMAY